MMKIHNLGTDRPYLALPDAFPRYKLTLLEEEDLPTITSILSNKFISQYLNNVPEPCTLKDAKYWYNLQPSNGDIKSLRETAGTKEEQEERSKSFCPGSHFQSLGIWRADYWLDTSVYAGMHGNGWRDLILQAGFH